ncbi:MAG: hypothetical protein RLN82_02405, partial [Pseudomonadales bacterium]
AEDDIYQARITSKSRIDIEDKQDQGKKDPEQDSPLSSDIGREKTADTNQRKTGARRRGPKPLFTTEQEDRFIRVIQAVENWKDNVAEVCRRLDEEGLPIPKPQNREQYPNFKTWTDYLQNGPGEKNLVKLIERRLPKP